MNRYTNFKQITEEGSLFPPIKTKEQKSIENILFKENIGKYVSRREVGFVNQFYELKEFDKNISHILLRGDKPKEYNWRGALLTLIIDLKKKDYFLDEEDFRGYLHFNEIKFEDIAIYEAEFGINRMQPRRYSLNLGRNTTYELRAIFFEP